MSFADLKSGFLISVCARAHRYRASGWTLAHLLAFFVCESEPEIPIAEPQQTPDWKFAEFAKSMVKKLATVFGIPKHIVYTQKQPLPATQKRRWIAAALVMHSDGGGFNYFECSRSTFWEAYFFNCRPAELRDLDGIFTTVFPAHRVRPTGPAQAKPERN